MKKEAQSFFERKIVPIIIAIGILAIGYFGSVAMSKLYSDPKYFGFQITINKGERADGGKQDP